MKHDSDTYPHVRRGFHDHDVIDLAAERLQIVAGAAREMSQIIDWGYSHESTLTFVSNHYQLTERQRGLLARSVSGEKAAVRRTSKLVEIGNLRRGMGLIDGFNLIVALEVALSGSPLLRGQDSSIRDLAGMRGTYRIIHETPRAVGLVLDVLGSLGDVRAEVLFDEPVSNSGRLVALFNRTARERGLNVHARTCAQVDKALFDRPLVVSSDSLVLDRCKSWINLAAACLERVPDPWIVDLFES